MLMPYFTYEGVEAGCDEAGRGCLAGPVFAAAVVLPKDIKLEALNDSKKLTPAARSELRYIIEDKAIAFGVAMKTHQEIDKLNILRASILSMHDAVGKLNVKPHRLLIDGNRFYPYPDIPHHCIVKGDGKYMSIAAASILAKTYRDDYMNELDAQYPGYGFKEHKGYPTPAHRMAIASLGPCDVHRLSFRLLPENDTLLLFDQETNP